MASYKENRKNVRSEGIVVDLNERLFYYLGKISPYCIACKIIDLLAKHLNIKKSHNFVEFWVMGNIFFSVVLSYTVFNIFQNKTLLLISLFYALLRVFEIVIYQINVSLFDIYRSKLKNEDYKIKSPTRTVILLLHNYIEIIFWYAVMVISILKLSNFLLVENYGFYIQSSFLCLTTFNHDLIANISNSQYYYLSGIAIFEVVSGLIMTIISLANFIGRLPSEYQKE